MLKYCNAIQLKQNIERYAIICKRFPRVKGEEGGNDPKEQRTALSTEELEELESLFSLYDADGNGTLDMDEMKSIFEFYPDSGITADDLRAMFQRYGKTQTEGLTLREFTEFMRKAFVDDSAVV
jgi:Ca2+-binding EF-hand superfamily protein